MAHKTVYRGFSRKNSFGLLCAGEMHKEGISSDTLMAKYPFYCMVLILKGRGIYEDQRGGREVLEPGMIVQRFPDRRHTVKIDPASHWHEVFAGFGILEFDNPARQRERAGRDFWKADIMYPRCNKTMGYLENLFIVNPDKPVISLRTNYHLEKDFLLLKDKLDKAPSGSVPGLIGDMLGLFSRISQMGQSFPPENISPLVIARDLLERGLEQRIPLPVLLEPVPLSYAHLRETFKDRLGVSPGQYRIERRIERACYYLAAQHLTPGETADKLGYEDTSSFSKQFKKIMAMTPGEYIRRA